MSLEVLFGSIYVLAMAIPLWSLTQLNRFLAETRSIADQACLERFKTLARAQMYLALSVIVLMVGGALAGVAVIMRHGLDGIVVVIATNMVVLGLGLYHKKVEARARSLQAGSEALATEYRRVCGTWVTKALPDF